MIPARQVLARGDSESARGDELNGFLSERAGLLPNAPPLTSLPTSHDAWDAIAARLPELFRTLTARDELDAMPVLDASADALDDSFVWRACAIMGMFAHTYVRVLPTPPDALPAAIEQPWGQLCARLHRTQTALTYDDLIAYNWRPRDERHPERRDVEDLELLTPTVGTREERIFYLAQVEILSRGAPMIGAMVRAQEAAHAADDDALQRELVTMIDTLERAGKGAFLKIDANPYSSTYVDPVVWAKTVAPFAVAIRESSHAISGAAAPLFQALDVFIGRDRFDSRVGREGRRLRPAFSPHFRAFLEGLESVSVADMVRRSSSSTTKGLWHSLLQAYVGHNGFLAVHRRKAFAFLELAFKVGRSVTTGGFTGLFDDQTWEVAHAELEASRLERTDALGGWCPVAHPAEESRGALTSEGLVHVTIDLAGAGVRFRPGEHLSVVPQNDRALVERTLAALRATGDEEIKLDGRWIAARRAQGSDPVDRCTLRELLTVGRIRPLSRDAATRLAAFAGSEAITRIVLDRDEHKWELWDVLRLVVERSFDPRALWQADPWEEYSISKLVPPESARFYSISSAPDPDQPAADEAELLLAEVRYETLGGIEREGTGSGFLRRAAAEAHGDTSFRVQVVPAPRFGLPGDERAPIIMFAGGAGISPFRAFIAARARRADPAPAWLFLSTRSERHVALYRAELEPHLRAGWLRFAPVVTSGADARAGRAGIGDAIAANGAELSAAMLADDGPASPHLYVCGAAGFSVAVLDALEGAIAAITPEPDAASHAQLAIRRLIGTGRLQQDVFTADRGDPATRPEIDPSEVAIHNDEENGYWVVIDGGVYDVTEFAHRHPGGLAIVRENAGRDGTAAYRTIEHDLDPEIEAMLGMYKIGDVRAPDFGSACSVSVGPNGMAFFLVSDIFDAWVSMLYRVVEVQNAVRHDFAILDAVTVAGDPPERMTLLKAQLLVEAHRRFLSIYVPSLLGPGLTDLWSMTAGLCAPDVDARALRHAIDDVERSVTVAAESDRLADLTSRIRSLGHAEPLAREPAFVGFTALRAQLEELDMRFLARLKELIAGGVRTFEASPRDAAGRAGSLVEPLAAIPGLLASLYDELTADPAREEASAAQR